MKKRTIARAASYALFAFFMLKEGITVTQPIAEPLPAYQHQPAYLSNTSTFLGEVYTQLAEAAPREVRGLYASGWTAGSTQGMDRLYSLIDGRHINAIVVDIKDASGRLSYQPLDLQLQAIGVGTRRIGDLPALIEELHSRGVYVIGRISVFQDPFYAEKFPDEALKNSFTGELWRDYKGLAYLRPDSQAVWDYTIAIARDAYTQGFDEINLDYVRYPSDGFLFLLDRPKQASERRKVIEKFFAYTSEVLRDQSRIPLSADLFGLTMSSKDDLGIGQVLEDIAPHVDYVCPMVYPSHFAPGSFGLLLPATKPYMVIKESLSRGVERLTDLGIPKERLRPWLQDFDLGATYTAEMVQAQIQATEELGIASWLMWDPANRYTEAAFKN